jgi:hypothetical protein
MLPPLKIALIINEFYFKKPTGFQTNFKTSPFAIYG